MGLYSEACLQGPIHMDCKHEYMALSTSISICTNVWLIAGSGEDCSYPCGYDVDNAYSTHVGTCVHVDMIRDNAYSTHVCTFVHVDNAYSTHVGTYVHVGKMWIIPIAHMWAHMYMWIRYG